MTESAIDQAVKQLRDERERLRAKLTDIERQRNELATQLDRVESGLAALAGQRKEARARKSPKSPAPSLTADEVVGLLAIILRESGPLVDVELKAALDSKVRAEGRSRSGLHTSLKRALKDSRFKQDATGRWQLANPGAAPALP